MHQPDRRTTRSARPTVLHVVGLGSAALCSVTLAAVLGARDASLVAELLARSGPRQVDDLVEVAVTGLGSLVALWLGISSLLALACLGVRAAGATWRTGERLVHRYAPALVRRSLVLVVGAGLGLGVATGATAAEPAPAAVTVAGSVGATVPAPSATTGTPDAVPTTPAPAPSTRTAAPASTPAATPTPAPPPAPASVQPAAPSAAPRSSAAAPSTAAPSAAAPSAAAPSAAAQSAAAPSATAPAAAAPPAVAAPAAADPTAASRLVVPPAARATATTGSTTVVVVRGDSLWRIAQRHLPAGADAAQVAAAWPEWYAANVATIGDDPGVLLPGQVLTVPAQFVATGAGAA